MKSSDLIGIGLIMSFFKISACGLPITYEAFSNGFRRKDRGVDFISYQYSNKSSHNQDMSLLL